MQYGFRPVAPPAEPTGQPTSFPDLKQPPYGPLDPIGRTRGRRVVASTLILIAAVLLTITAVVPWWSLSWSNPTESATIGFVPGSTYTVTGMNLSQGFSDLTSYPAQTGALYQGVLLGAVVAGLAAFLAMLLGFLGSFGVLGSRRFFGLTVIAAVVAVVGAAGLPAIVALYQPATVNANSNYGSGQSGCPSGASPCTSFWGASSGSGLSMVWGADLGWYLAVAAAVLLAIAIALLWVTRRQPYTQDEVEVAYLRTSAD